MNIMNLEIEKDVYLHEVGSSACLFIQEFINEMDEEQTIGWCRDFLSFSNQEQVDSKINEWQKKDGTLINRNFGYELEFAVMLLITYLETK